MSSPTIQVPAPPPPAALVILFDPVTGAVSHRVHGDVPFGPLIAYLEVLKYKLIKKQVDDAEKAPQRPLYMPDGTKAPPS